MFLRDGQHLPVCRAGNSSHAERKGPIVRVQLASSLDEYALTDAAIEGAALYRTLRRLEAHGYVKSDWDTEGAGPARRVYLLTKNGEHHLEEWAEVLGRLSKAMARFTRKAVSGRPSKAKMPRPAPSAQLIPKTVTNA